MMKMVRIVAVAGLLLSSALQIAAEECELLQDAVPDRLVSYLDSEHPDQQNAACITLAINKLGDERYVPAIDVLAKLLDFRRPATSREKQGLYIHIQSIDEVYPAAKALEQIGEEALPAILDAIKAGTTSRTGRENALFVWMEIYKSESPRAISLLRNEFNKSEEAVSKRNLQWALSHAPNWCNPSDKEQCDLAARAPR
jgi:hypothetical protein